MRDQDCGICIFVLFCTERGTAKRIPGMGARIYGIIPGMAGKQA